MIKRIIVWVIALVLLASPLGATQFFGGGGGSSGATSVGLTNNGGTTQVGSTVITGIGQPSAPVVTPNTTGTTTATYYCDALDLNGLTNLTGGIGNTIPSAVTTITNGAATPNTTVKCGGQTGAMGYVVTKGATGGATSELGSCLTLGSGNSCTVADTGQALTTYTANSLDETNALNSGAITASSLSLSGTSFVDLTQSSGNYGFVIGAAPRSVGLNNRDAGVENWVCQSVGTIGSCTANGNWLFTSNVQQTKQSSAPSAPGAATCEVFTVAGTNSGTCKIQAECGTSATPVTIVDNVGGGC